MTEIVTSVAALREATSAWRHKSRVIGLAPTMGNLHAGHLALVNALRSTGAECIVATIFVNPTQFGASEDFASYPRTFEDDRTKLAAAGVDLLFAPPVEEVYPAGPSAVIEVPDLSSDLCGAFRPGHFSGVATVVAKLFNMSRADVAAFGEKDYQQLVVIRRLVASLHFPIRIVGVPTERDADGLALSSRNQYLSPEDRRRAPLLFKTLCEARDAIGNDEPVVDAEKRARASLEESGFVVDYVSVRRVEDLGPPVKPEGELIVLAAARLGATRLIDNLKFDLPAGDLQAQ